MSGYDGVLFRVRFHDTDHSGRVYFANYVKWMDDEVVEFFRSKGIVFPDLQRTQVGSESIEGTFVIGEFTCRINAPSKFDDIVKVRSSIAEVKPKVLKFESEVLGANTGLRLARGSITYIWVRGERSAPIPEQILERIRVD